MHEWSICKSILKTLQQAAQRQKFERVLSVTVGIGGLSCLDAQALQFGFEVFRQGSIAENAVLNVVDIEVKAKCPECQHVFLATSRFPDCPLCGQAMCDIIQGDDIIIQTIEVQ
jgi:hydrogenase nickel incorporation protein HypA/HybF